MLAHWTTAVAAPHTRLPTLPKTAPFDAERPPSADRAAMKQRQSSAGNADQGVRRILQADAAAAWMA